MPVAKPKAREADVTVVELDGEAVVYDRRSGVLHHLNPGASLVYRVCDGTSTIAELAADIADAVGQPVARIEPEVRAAIRGLRKADLLEPTRR
jgi:PqqD family protein of HPr-rel-A system